MTRILVVNASPNTETSKSRLLTARYVEKVTSGESTADVVYRDVGVTPPPHLDSATIGAFFTPAENRTDEQKALIALSDQLVGEVRDADIIVIGSPMQNFGMSSGLKTWFDHIARAGVTFRYTENGPEGLLGGRKVIIVTATGGDYSEGSQAAHLNHQLPHLKTLFGFLGIDDVSVAEASKTAVDDEGVAAAASRIDLIAAEDIATRMAA
ncbi:MAG: NAD(P)H-dependent oxidoreductase [Rhodospirillales bacterium]